METCHKNDMHSTRTSRIFLVLFTGTALALSTLADASEQAEEEKEDVQSVVVMATRSSQLVKDQAVRVEVVPDVEIEENLTVAPGNLTNLLNELAGARMQASAPGSGGTSLQLRGLPGRHAQILWDGLPLAGSTGSFSLIQTTPLDLSRVELIKGVASALYGGSALSGVMNLVSRAPGEPSQVLFSQSTLGATDLVAFLAGPKSTPWGYTLTGSIDHQSRKDPDHDGWSELPGYSRVTLRPRLYWSDSADRSVYATFGFVQEDRKGGTMPGRTLADGNGFREALDTRRIDGGTVARFALDDSRIVNARWSTTISRHERELGTTRVDDSQALALGEVTLQGTWNAHQWTMGAALQYERLHTGDVEGVGYDYTVPGIFFQDEFSPATWLSLAASARVDDHSDYGTFVSPRISALFRTGEKWSLRASAGTGFSAPTPLIEDIEARSLALLVPTENLQAERGSSVSLDAKWASRPWDLNLSLFRSEIRHPLDVREAMSPGRLELVNGDGALRSRGIETLIGLTIDDFHLLANATYLDVTERPENLRTDAPLVPRFSAEIAWILEEEDLGRIGVEVSYTGHQSLEDNPYRERSRDFFEINALAEVKWRELAIFLNVLNITNMRQQRYDELLRPSPGLGGVRITEAWAPLVGRSVNLGVRAEF